MFTPVDPAIREKVISAYLAGHGKNQITRDLNEQGIKISHGSVSNFINAYKRQHEQTSQSDANMNNTDSHSSLTTPSAVERVVTTNTNSDSIPRDGGPLSHLLGEDTSTDDEEVIPLVISYSSSPSPVVPVLTPPKQEPFPEPKSKDLFIKDPSSQVVLEEESEESVGGL